MTWLWPDEWDDPGLRSACEDLSRETGAGILALAAGVTYTSWTSGGGRTSGFPSSVLLLLEPGAIDAAGMLDWRESLSRIDPPVKVRFLRRPAAAPPGGWAQWLRESIGEFGRMPTEEDVGLEVGSLVGLPETTAVGSERGYEPYVLTVPPDGPLAPVLDRLDSIRRTFENMRPPDFANARRRFHNTLDSMLGDPSSSKRDQLRSEVTSTGFSQCDRSQLPRVLLLGESGTGKTVLARYLAEHPDHDIPFDRVPIPEYLGREDQFESDVFGYCEGAYTDARREGSRGTLGELIGGVVFFDEIGDASPTIQAKLLAFLDDYVVRPRGLSGRGYYCPTLVVAATNRAVLGGDGVAGAEPLRRDLLNRFDTVLRAPSLTDRIDELELQVDLVIQKEAAASLYTRAFPIRRVGAGAMQRIRGHDFSDQNFRLLERVLSTACRRARADRRNYLVAADLTLS